jgi:hypothetical protein
MLTTIPSFKSAPRMRSVPPNGFSPEIRPMSPVSSVLSRGRPSLVLDLQVQQRRQPFRCPQDHLRPHETKVLSPTLRPKVVKPDPQDPVRSPKAGCGLVRLATWS